MNTRTLKLLADWFVPPRCQRLYREMTIRRAFRLTAYESVILSRNSKFHNMYAGKRCFVIGNGPSLNKQDLTPLADEVTIVMNSFNRHPIIEKWKPTLFCMAEPKEGLKPEELTLFADSVCNIEAQAYFFRIDVKEIFDQRRFVDPEKIYYLKTGCAPPYGWPVSRQSIDLSRTIPGCQTTAHMAIMIALYLGCSPIYLIGLDHDWLAQPSVATHFYAGSAQDDFSMLSYKQIMEAGLRVWTAHEWIRDVASKQGVVIYNATDGGFLDVFARADYKSVIESMGVSPDSR